MNFAFSEEQEFLRSPAREFLERECPLSRVREFLDDPSGRAGAHWPQVVELGWPGLLIPEALGGAGLGFVELAIIQEELGRALAPTPLFAHLQGTLALLYAADESLKSEFLPEVARAARVLALAIEEDAGVERAEQIATRAHASGNAHALHGVKRFVSEAQAATHLVVAARTDGADPAHISWFLVERDAPGVSLRPQDSIDRTRRMAEIEFEGAPARLLGEENRGWETWEYVRDRALVALAADALGGARRCLESAVEYAKEREQFGRPIGVNQAVQHRCADMVVAVESAAALTYYAAWAVDCDAPEAPLAAAMAKAQAGDAYRQNSADALQLHGGVGFTWEYDCHLYYKRARSIEHTYGDAAQQRKRVADLLDL